MGRAALGCLSRYFGLGAICPVTWAFILWALLGSNQRPLPCKVRQSPPAAKTAGRRDNSLPEQFRRALVVSGDCRWFATFHGLTRPVDGLPSAKGEGTACLSERSKARTSDAWGLIGLQDIVPGRGSTPAVQRCFGAGPYAATVTRRSWGCVVSSGTGSPDATRSSM